MMNIPRQHFSAHLSLLFTQAPFAERFALAAGQGFSAVECWSPEGMDAPTCKHLLVAHGLQMVCINTAAGDEANGEFGLALHAHRRDAFRSSVLEALAYAEAIDCPHVHVLAGHRVPGDDDARLRATYLDNLLWAADEAGRARRTVLIEALNPFDRPRYFLSQPSTAFAIAQTLNHPHLRVIFDVYHAQMTQGRLIETFREQQDWIGHVQVADVPGRHEPGTGEIHFPAVFDAIARSGYLDAGKIGCEYRPSAGGVAFSWLTTSFERGEGRLA